MLLHITPWLPACRHAVYKHTHRLSMMPGKQQRWIFFTAILRDICIKGADGCIHKYTLVYTSTLKHTSVRHRPCSLPSAYAVMVATHEATPPALLSALPSLPPYKPCCFPSICYTIQLNSVLLI